MSAANAEKETACATGSRRVKTDREMKMRGKKILIVDDEADMRIFVSTIMESGGLIPAAAGDGAEALQRARSDPPDLIILDVMMPRIEDGIETFRTLKSEPGLCGIPVVMLSAIARKTFFHSLKMLSPGREERIPEPEAYMEKPPEADELLRLVKRLLNG